MKKPIYYEENKNNKFWNKNKCKIIRIYMKKTNVSIKYCNYLI